MGQLDGTRLKLRRVQAGIRPTHLARELGIAVALLSDWEDGRRPISPRQERHLLDAIERLTLGATREAGCDGRA